ncbi:glycosyltransferase family 2 protein [uncultured Clostridium sp.]|uniref:glycosyltransferase family 2 protein n=1 Tax=uncultured Clostridium sp. TaxID=59620 RepID=UPI00261DEB58|nr:glycosyltransferase family 2 protein [uncultured Clostridium sp.]
MNDKICATIITYNCGEGFINTFNSVYNQVKKIVIVDNGSEKTTIDLLERLKKEYPIELILCKENLGIAAALNKGVKYALDNGYDWVMTLDHDSNLKEDMAKKLLEAYYRIGEEKRKKVVSLLPRYIELGLDQERQDARYTNTDIQYVEGGITSGNLVNRKAFEEVGYFDEKLFIDFVDYDFCFRIKEKGLNIVEVANAILYHRIGKTKSGRFFFKKVSATNHSPSRRYYITRNRIYCWKKYKGVVDDSIKFDKSCAVKEAIKILLYEENKLLKMKMIVKGIKDAKRNKFGKITE